MQWGVPLPSVLPGSLSQHGQAGLSGSAATRFFLGAGEATSQPDQLQLLGAMG